MCKICDAEPGSHSFMKMAKQGTTTFFYTCPSEAKKYWDTKGILEHISESLRENDGEHWIWIVDADGFEIKHSIQISTAIGIVKILSEQGDSLKEIRIINPNRFISILYNAIYPFMTTSFKSKIQWIK
jgi:hypothetical protein